MISIIRTFSEQYPLDPSKGSICISVARTLHRSPFGACGCGCIQDTCFEPFPLACLSFLMIKLAVLVNTWPLMVRLALFPWTSRRIGKRIWSTCGISTFIIRWFWLRLSKFNLFLYAQKTSLIHAGDISNTVVNIAGYFQSRRVEYEDVACRCFRTRTLNYTTIIIGSSVILSLKVHEMRSIYK